MGEIRPLVITLPLMKPFGLLGGVTGLEMHGDSLSVSQPGRSLAESGLTVCGMKAYKNYIPLTLPAPLFPHWQLQEKRNHPQGADFLAFCDFLILKRAQLWRTQRLGIRHVTEVATVSPLLRGWHCDFAGCKIRANMILLNRSPAQCSAWFGDHLWV